MGNIILKITEREYSPTISGSPIIGHMEYVYRSISPIFCKKETYPYIEKKISRKIFVKFGNNPYTCFMSKELYSEIEDLIIRWSNDGDKTAGHLTRQIMESLLNEKHKHVIIDLRNMDYFKDEEGNIIYYDTLGEACDVCGMYEFEDSWVMRLMYNHRENGETDK